MSETRRCRPLLLLAAWVSPVIPVVAAVATVKWTNALPSGSRADTLAFGLACLACLIGFLSACVGWFGVKANGWLATAPVASLGLLLNAGVGLPALLLWGLSQGSRC
jgi:hypothetical protein